MDGVCSVQQGVLFPASPGARQPYMKGMGHSPGQMYSSRGPLDAAAAVAAAWLPVLTALPGLLAIQAIAGMMCCAWADASIRGTTASVCGNYRRNILPSASILPCDMP